MHPKPLYRSRPLALQFHTCQHSFISKDVHFTAWAVLPGKHKCLTGDCCSKKPPVIVHHFGPKERGEGCHRGLEESGSQGEFLSCKKLMQIDPKFESLLNHLSHLPCLLQNLLSWSKINLKVKGVIMRWLYLRVRLYFLHVWPLT